MNRIKELRKGKNITLIDLGKQLNIPKSSLSRYERGDVEPKHETWEQLADFFKVPVDYLQGYSNDRAGWHLWEEATGYNRETIEAEILQLIEANRLNPDDDLQKQIGKAIEFLDNRGKTDKNAVEEARRGLNQLSHRIHDDFYIDPNKINPDSFWHGVRIRHIDDDEYDGSLYYNDMDKEVYDEIRKILEEAYVKLTKYMTSHKFDNRHNHYYDPGSVELGKYLDDSDANNSSPDKPTDND